MSIAVVFAFDYCKPARRIISDTFIPCVSVAVILQTQSSSLVGLWHIDPRQVLMMLISKPPQEVLAEQSSLRIGVSCLVYYGQAIECNEHAVLRHDQIEGRKESTGL